MPNYRQEALPYRANSTDIEAMPKSVPGIHLGEKLREAMHMRGLSQAQVAREFGVTPPTVSSDWLKHGRIGKQHFPHLVEFFRLPYEFWFGQPAPTSGVFLIRRNNLRTIVSERFGGKRGLAAKAFGLSVKELAAYENGETPIETDAARHFEKVAEKTPGWLDVPPHRDPQSRTIDERLAALPGPLRTYALHEIELCEKVAQRIPGEFLNAPTAANARAFREYLVSLLEQGNPGKRSAA